MAHAWKACWVQALGGSNPPSSATGPRDRFRFRGFCCLQPRLISGRRESCPPASRPRRVLLLVVLLVFWAPEGPAALMGLAAVPVGGGPPASRPRRELRSARRLEARPGPATAHGHRSQALRALRRPPHRRHLCRLDYPGQAPPPPTGTAARPSGPSGALHTGDTCGAVRTGRQSGGYCVAEPRPRPLRLRGPRRSLRPGARPGPRPSQRASSGAGPSRCSSIRPRTPSR